MDLNPKRVMTSRGEEMRTRHAQKGDQVRTPGGDGHLHAKERNQPSDTWSGTQPQDPDNRRLSQPPRRWRCLPPPCGLVGF